MCDVTDGMKASENAELHSITKSINFKENVQTSVCDIYAQRTMNCTNERNYEDEIH